MADRTKTSDVSGTWWVDERGNWRLVDPTSNRDHISRPFGPDLTQESAGYRAIGCVKVAVDEGFICINWDVCEVEIGAIQAVLHFLQRDSRSREVVLNFFYAGWNSERWASSSEAAGRIEQTTAYRRVELIDTVLMEHQDLSAIEKASPDIKRAFEIWQRTGGRFDRSDKAGLGQLSRQILTFAPDETEDGLVFEHIGPESDLVQCYGPDWAQCQIGLPSDFNGPDQALADRICRSYAPVLAEGAPRYDHIRALIHRDIGEPLWGPYQRLLLPCRQPDGSPLLVCLTSVTQDISIPFLEARATPAAGGDNILQLSR